ncbi:MAG: FtsX-like permease family protein [Spirochaetaceae bacterium]|jgi:ABC-type lipoprotein release transport system permease subunit|nr:FtsX-like permease family protein [Spirochaetaceae bacterium]
MKLSGIWELKKIALRNLARHKVKTVLTAMAIMVSVAVYIFLNSFLGGMAIESRRNIVNYEIGAAKLQTKLYFEKKDEMPSYENFTGWEIYREALESEGYCSAPRFTFSGTLSSTSGSAPIMFYAVEPAAEAEVLRYVPYVDFGRFVQNGKFEIALGTVAAEKLKVGIPTRPFRLELEELIASVTQDEGDFIRSLYDVAAVKRGGPFSPDEKTVAGNERMILKKNASRSDLDRCWNMIATSGRNDVRINAVIDIKAAPAMIRPDKWEGELLPALRGEDLALVQAAYEYDDQMDIYLLIEEDEQQLERILAAMVRADYSGAVSHVNQSIDAVIAGVINSPDPLPNGNTAYIPLDILQDEAGMMLEGAVTELVIREKNINDSRLPGKSESAAVITAALNRGLSAQGRSLPDDLAVYFWLEYMKDYLGYEAIQTGAPQIFAFLLLILSFLGISNTILLAILERTREIGMMRALGMTDKQMIIVYMLEAGFLGFIGSILGIILGCVINYPVVTYGFDFSAMADTLQNGIGFRTTGNFRSIWNVPVIIGSGIVATLLASFMAYFPTRRTVKMPIADSLRFE